MSQYDKFRELFADESAETKLAFLRHESIRFLGSARGYSHIIQTLIEERKPAELPDNFGDFCKRVVDNLETLQDLIDAATDKKHRSVRQEEQARRRKESSERFWEGHQIGLPELRPYASMQEAVVQTADGLGLSFASADLRIDDKCSDYTFFSTPERRARIAAQSAGGERYRYLGYVVHLQLLVDWRNIQWDKHEGLSPSFDEAVIVLHRWLIKGHPLPAIQAEFQWMGGNVGSQ